MGGGRSDGPGAVSGTGEGAAEVALESLELEKPLKSGVGSASARLPDELSEMLTSREASGDTARGVVTSSGGGGAAASEFPLRRSEICSSNGMSFETGLS